MKIYQCDICHVEVNDYAHWYNDAEPRSMYELQTIHDFKGATFEGLIICHKCIEKMMNREVTE